MATAPSAKVDAPSFCRPVDSTPHLAVLGVLGTEHQIDVRAAIRATWLPGGADADILANFVLRGLGVQSATLEEAAQHRDIVFVRSESGQSRLVGPIWSLFLWLECAYAAWPHAKLIGRAETDTWQDLPGVAARLLADFEALRVRAQRSTETTSTSPPLIYWGVMESFHWNLRVQRPKGFAYKFGASALQCEVRQSPTGDKGPMINVALPPNASSARDTFVGPFSFGKGPLVIISRDLVGTLITPSSWAWSSLRQISWRVNELNDPAVLHADAYPQDDAWLGMAISATVGEGAVGNRPLVALHAGARVSPDLPAKPSPPLTFPVNLAIRRECDLRRGVCGPRVPTTFDHPYLAQRPRPQQS